MRLQEIIRRKRDGLSLSAEEITAFIKAATVGEASRGRSAHSQWRSICGE